MSEEGASIDRRGAEEGRFGILRWLARAHVRDHLPTTRHPSTEPPPTRTQGGCGRGCVSSCLVGV